LFEQFSVFSEEILEKDFSVLEDNFEAREKGNPFSGMGLKIGETEGK
jgi:hypothetical protein